MRKNEEEEDARMDTMGNASDSRTESAVAPHSTTITADDLDNLRHMLGVSERCRRGYRNYFVAGGSDVASMERLRAAGFVVKNERYTGSPEPCYHATIEGARAVGLRSLPR